MGCTRKQDCKQVENKQVESKKRGDLSERVLLGESAMAE